MCGIIYVKRLDGKLARRMAWKRYKFQKLRGQQGYGYVGMKDGVVECLGRARLESEMEKMINKDDVSTDILLHHRMPTSTPNLLDATHPIFVKNDGVLKGKEYYVIHNGIISNPDQLKIDHEKLGFIYQTTVFKKLITKTEKIMQSFVFNDSEALAIDLALVFSENKKTLETRGSIAFIAIEVESKTQKVLRVLFGRNTTNPLRMDRTKEHICLSSEGSGVEIKPHTLHSLNPKTNTLTMSDMDIGYKYIELKRDDTASRGSNFDFRTEEDSFDEKGPRSVVFQQGWYYTKDEHCYRVPKAEEDKWVCIRDSESHHRWKYVRADSKRGKEYVAKWGKRFPGRYKSLPPIESRDRGISRLPMGYTLPVKQDITPHNKTYNLFEGKDKERPPFGEGSSGVDKEEPKQMSYEEIADIIETYLLVLYEKEETLKAKLNFARSNGMDDEIDEAEEELKVVQSAIAKAEYDSGQLGIEELNKEIESLKEDAPVIIT